MDSVSRAKRPHLSSASPHAGADAASGEELELLRAEVALLRADNAALRVRLERSEDAREDATQAHEQPHTLSTAHTSAGSPPAVHERLQWHDPCSHGLSSAQLRRFARHVAVAGFGPKCQGALASCRVLVVGAGGLGCPAAMYLAAAGVGELAIADGDVVEESNLQRQVLYTEADVGTSKAASAVAALVRRNSGVACRALPAVRPDTAVSLLRGFHVCLDCTDNPASRYMLSDAALCAGIPLVSGAAIGAEGQVTVLCGDPSDAARVAPCYRCVYPTPPRPGHCATCAQAGVLGPVTGVIGTLQAMEAIKVVAQAGTPLRGTLLCYDALSGDTPMFAMQLTPPRPDCPACGSGQDALWRRWAAGDVRSLDGDVIAAAAASESPSAAPAVPPTWPRLSVHELAARRRDGEPHVLVDVRPAHVFQLACLKGAVSIPFKESVMFDSERFIWDVEKLRLREKMTEELLAEGEDGLAYAYSARGGAPVPIILLCRAGNTSAKAAAALTAAGMAGVYDVEGGLLAWRTHIDPTFPMMA